MFGLGMSELILLGVLALILIGPKQLPEVARTLGRFINDLKRSAEGLTDEIKKQATVDLDLDSLDPRKEQKKSQQKAQKPKDEFVPLPDPVNQNYSHEEAMKPDVPVVKIEPPEHQTVAFNPTSTTESKDSSGEKKE